VARSRAARQDYERRLSEYQQLLQGGRFGRSSPSGQNNDGNCKMVTEGNQSNIFASQSEAEIAARTRGLPQGATNLGAPQCEWVNFVLGEPGNSTPIPGRRGYRCSVSYQRNICYGKPAAGRQQ
jgi:hypothetical protein